MREREREGGVVTRRLVPELLQPIPKSPLTVVHTRSAPLASSSQLGSQLGNQLGKPISPSYAPFTQPFHQYLTRGIMSGSTKHLVYGCTVECVSCVERFILLDFPQSRFSSQVSL